MKRFVSYYIAMAKRFLNSMCCNPFIQLEANILKDVHLTQRLSSPLGPTVFSFSGGNNVLVRPCKMYVLRYVSLSLDPTMRSMLLANLREFLRRQ